MDTSLDAFNIGLNEEHLDEVSFLYEQRQVLRVSSDRSWQDLAAIEERLQAHLDALVVGEAIALEVCSRVASEGDVGHLFGAMCIFCRQKSAAALARTLQTLDHSNAKRVRAVTDALKHELPPEWSTSVTKALAQGDVHLAPVLASVAGYRSMQEAAGLLVDTLARQPTNATEFIEALGRLHAVQAQPQLSTYLHHVDPVVRHAATVALMRCGVFMSQHAQWEAIAAGRQPCIPFALCGGRDLHQVLLRAARTPSASADCLLALGLLGDPSAVRTLTDALDDKTIAPSAAQALEWITGAGLHVQIFVPDEVDEALLFTHELSAWQQAKQAPRRLDGQPYGRIVEQVCQDKDDWRRWCSNNAFDPSLRYRNGRPVSPGTLVADLAAPETDSRLRELTALELEIRYGCEIAFDVDMPVVTQVQALRHMESWANSVSDRFASGRW